MCKFSANFIVLRNLVIKLYISKLILRFSLNKSALCHFYVLLNKCILLFYYKVICTVLIWSFIEKKLLQIVWIVHTNFKLNLKGKINIFFLKWFNVNLNIIQKESYSTRFIHVVSDTNYLCKENEILYENQLFNLKSLKTIKLSPISFFC